jgi:hypothetical protein
VAILPDLGKHFHAINEVIANVNDAKSAIDRMRAVVI